MVCPVSAFSFTSKMATYFIDIPTPLVLEDPRFPDEDERLIYEHLRHFCSKLFTLPSIDVALVAGKLTVTRGHKYLRAARELGHTWLRACYQSLSHDPAGVLAELPAGVKFSSRELLEREAAVSVAREFHVYFFDGALSGKDQARFSLRHRRLLRAAGDAPT